MEDSTKKKKRRSKWDQPAPDQSIDETSKSSEDASVSAACAAARINAMLEAQGKITRKGVANSTDSTSAAGNSRPAPPPAEIEINDSEARGVLTKGPTLSDIAKTTGASVTVRGRFMSPEEKAKSNSNDRPLYLCIQAPTQSFINAAVQKIRSIMYEAESGKSPVPLFISLPPQPSQFSTTSSQTLPNSHQYLQDKVYVGLDEVDESFDLIKKLQGPDDSFLTHIGSSTGAKVFLRGRGSGYKEPLSGRESFEALYIYINHPNSEGLTAARKLSESLIDTVKRDYNAFMSARVRHINPYHQPHPFPPHPHPPHPHPPHPQVVGNFHPQMVPPHPEQFGPRPHPLQPHPFQPHPPHIGLQQAVAPPPHFPPPQVIPPPNHYYEPHPYHHGYGPPPPRPHIGPPPPFLGEPMFHQEMAPPPAPPPPQDTPPIEGLAYHQLPRNGGPPPPNLRSPSPPPPPPPPTRPTKRKFTEDLSVITNEHQNVDKTPPPHPTETMVPPPPPTTHTTTNPSPLKVAVMPPPSFLPPPKKKTTLTSLAPPAVVSSLNNGESVTVNTAISTLTTTSTKVQPREKEASDINKKPVTDSLSLSLVSYGDDSDSDS